MTGDDLIMLRALGRRLGASGLRALAAARHREAVLLVEEADRLEAEPPDTEPAPPPPREPEP